MDAEKTEAICLNGSPGGLMFSKGYGSGRNKIIAHLSGGYWCMGRDRDEVLTECV